MNMAVVYEVRIIKGNIDRTFTFHDEYYAMKTKEEKQREGFKVDITIKRK